MASYQTRHRDPLLDQNVQAMLERRGKELLGLALIGLALAAALMLWTYTPEDPGWMVATDEPARNALGPLRRGGGLDPRHHLRQGRLGHSRDPAGLGSALRDASRRGPGDGPDDLRGDRGRGGVGLCRYPCAGADWTHSFGLGGLFGDTIVGALLGDAAVCGRGRVEAFVAAVGFAVVAMGLYVTGFDRQELRDLGRFLLFGLVMSYAWVATMLGRGAAGTARAAQMARERHAERREARLLSAADGRGRRFGRLHAPQRCGGRGRGSYEPAAACRRWPDRAPTCASGRMRAMDRMRRRALTPTSLRPRRGWPRLRCARAAGCWPGCLHWSSARWHRNSSSPCCRPRRRRPRWMMPPPKTASAPASRMRSAAGVSPQPNRPLPPHSAASRRSSTRTAGTPVIRIPPAGATRPDGRA